MQKDKVVILKPTEAHIDHLRTRAHFNLHTKMKAWQSGGDILSKLDCTDSLMEGLKQKLESKEAG